VKAVENAKRNNILDTPVIIHSDRGVQFVSNIYLEATPASKFIHSYSRKGNPWDNAVIESFHSLIKREWLNRYVIKNLIHAHKLVFEYIDAFYNTKRIHGHCNMKSPYDFEVKQAV
jgi:putative transposase